MLVHRGSESFNKVPLKLNLSSCLVTKQCLLFNFNPVSYTAQNWTVLLLCYLMAESNIDQNSDWCWASWLVVPLHDHLCCIKRLLSNIRKLCLPDIAKVRGDSNICRKYWWLTKYIVNTDTDNEIFLSKVNVNYGLGNSLLPVELFHYLAIIID